MEEEFLIQEMSKGNIKDQFTRKITRKRTITDLSSIRDTF